MGALEEIKTVLDMRIAQVSHFVPFPTILPFTTLSRRAQWLSLASHAEDKLMAKKMTHKKLFRPTGCLSPNEAGKKLGVSGEAIKQHIYKGNLKAAKAKNGYW